jgi:tRNA (guanine37-N1)-methyltransferase
MGLIEAAVRLLPGVMGAQASQTEESFEQGLLEYPQFTRPQSFEGREIPPILNSGNHAEIARWRQGEAERLTKRRRPDLWTLYEKLARSARRPASSDLGSAQGLPKDAKNEPDPDA